VIHHVSIPARDPQRVAQVLAELFGGYAGPFSGPIPWSWLQMKCCRPMSASQTAPRSARCSRGGYNSRE
jgi:hypothetical protein